MTDPAGDNKPVREPPKIKLNGMGELDASAKKPAPASIPPLAAKPPMTPPKGIAQRLAKAETSKIALTSAKPPLAAKPPLSAKPTISIADAARREDKIKKATTRIRSSSITEDMAQLTAAEEIEAAKKSTVRVHVEEVAKGDTQRLDNQLTEHEVEPDAKKKTARIDLNEVLQGDDSDIFKRRTALLDASKFPPGSMPTAQTSGPRTIRIKQSDAPSTSILKKPVAPPAAAEIDEPISPEMAGKKSETARIDLPPEAMGAQPPTRRKTIRIKRPEGGGVGGPSKALVVSRSEEPAFAPTVERTEEEGPGALFSVIALVATLVSIVLIYVLLAQTIPSGLPFPGKL